MLQENIRSGISFVVLILLQFLLFSNINLMGMINPFVYLLFVIRFRLDANQSLFIVLCFFLGLFIDLILGTAGAHTIATLTIGFLRPLIVGFSFGVNADIPYAMVTGTRIANQLTYLGLIISLHSILYYTIQYFDWSAFLSIIKNALFSTIFTFILIWLILGFYKPK